MRHDDHAFSEFRSNGLDKNSIELFQMGFRSQTLMLTRRCEVFPTHTAALDMSLEVIEKRLQARNGVFLSPVLYAALRYCEDQDILAVDEVLHDAFIHGK